MPRDAETRDAASVREKLDALGVTVKVLHVGDGEVVVLEGPKRLSADQAREIQDLWNREVGRRAIVTAGIRVAAARYEDVPVEPAEHAPEEPVTTREPVAATVYPFPYLIDSPEDGYVEEHGHLPLHAAATADEAAREFARVYEGGEDVPPIFVCSGRQQFLKPVVCDFDTGDDREPTVEELADWQMHESIRFTEAELGDPLALRWWVVEAIPRCDKYDEEGDFYCRRADAHDGPCAAKGEDGYAD